MRWNKLSPIGACRLLGITLVLLLVLPLSAAADEGQPAGVSQSSQCVALVDEVRKENKKLHRELRQIKREIALLNQNLEEPGLREIAAGIGYILGLCGVAALVATRRQGAEER